MNDPLRLGTRGSALARTQSQRVADDVTAILGRPVELVVIKTLGDVTTGPLAGMPQPGVFVSALRSALLAGEVDLIVHSMKDLPSEPEAGIALAAVPLRADPRDALLSHAHVGLDGLPLGATIGSSSPRRAARIRAVRPDLKVVDLRGNVDSRIAKVRTGELDATVLAVAGLTRLQRADEIDEIFDTETMLPAPAQGALAVEVRVTESDLVTELSALDDLATRVTTTAERAVLSAVSATCASAVGALGNISEGILTLVADVSGSTPDQYVTRSGEVTLSPDPAAWVAQAVELGSRVGAGLLADGASAFINPVLPDA